MEIDSERSRIRAALVNSGRFNFEEAEQKLASSRLSIYLASDAAQTVAGQAAFLTSVVTAARCFGEVTVHGRLNVTLGVPLPIDAETLADAAQFLGARLLSGELHGRAVIIGTQDLGSSVWSVQAYWDGWLAGVGARGREFPLGRGDCALAGVAAGALAVGQAFLAEQGDPRAGLFDQSVSLWEPQLDVNDAACVGPEYVSLPLALWLIGLGNLGQAYLWSTLMLPYPDPKAVRLFAQDDDRIKSGNWGTSVLSQRDRYGVLKTRLAEEWSEKRGFIVSRIDRRIDAATRRTDLEPGIVLSGLDRMEARKLLGAVGFDYIIDAGLGAGFDDYHKFRLNVFAAGQTPEVHFAGQGDEVRERVAKLTELPAYKAVSARMNDGGCGAALLAEQSVAVPFVSAFVGAMVMTQAIRLASGMAPIFSLTGNLNDLRGIRTTAGQKSELQIVPGVEVQLGRPSEAQIAKATESLRRSAEDINSGRGEPRSLDSTGTG